MSKTEIIRRNGIGMITVRGDFADPKFAQALGMDLPMQREITTRDGKTLAWMSPDEMLLMLPADAVAATLKRIAEALAGLHHLVVDVTDARAVFRISGPHAREVIAKGAPVDMAPGYFEPGTIRRTRLGQVAAAFWMAEDNAIDLICFSSVSDFVAEWLAGAAKPGSFPEIFVATG